jgi:eukaryotic-like serine/threonine-protein kinase
MENSDFKMNGFSLEDLLRFQAQRCSGGEIVEVEKLFETEVWESLSKQPNDLMSLICQEVSLREARGEKVGLEEYQNRFPQLRGTLAIQWEIDRLLSDRSLSAIVSEASTVKNSQPTVWTAAQSSHRATPTSIDRYKILCELGRGAVGVVYHAWDPKLKRNVAIKRLRFGLDASDEELQRIRSEAEAIAHVRHEHVVQIFDIGEVDGQPFLTMEVCMGGSLANRLAGKPMPAKQAAELVQKIASAIEAAHENNVIHRDLKPSNVLLGNETEWNPKVTDFGLAKILDGGGLNTETGYVLGTPTYMPPEQASGNAKSATPAMDVYSLGAILYECLTGRPPFRGLTVPETLELVRNGEPISVRRLEPRVPIELETIAAKCLRKLPEQRYATARDLVGDLGRYLDNRPIKARRMSIYEHGLSWCRRNPALSAALASSVLITTCSMALLGWMNVRLASEAEKKSIALIERTAALDEKSKALTERELAYLDSREKERLANQHFYNARIGLAQQAMHRNEMARAEDLLLPLEQSQAEFVGFEWHLLRNQLMHDLKWLSRDQLGEVMGVEFSKDDKLVLAVGGGLYSGYVRLLDAETGKQLASDRLRVIGNACAFCPTKSQFAIAGANGMTIRDNQTANIIRYIETSLHAKSLLWSSDGKYLFVGDEVGRLGIWNAENYTHVNTINAEKGPILRMFFSADQTRLYTSTDWGQEGRHSTQWKLIDGDLVKVREFERLSLSDESIDGELVVGMDWGELVVANATGTGSIVQRQAISTGPLHSARFQDGSSLLLLASRNDRELRSFSRSSLDVQKVYQVKKSLAAVAISSDKSRWVTADANGEIRMWGVVPDSEGHSQTDRARNFQFAQFLDSRSDLILGDTESTCTWLPGSKTESPLHETPNVQCASKNGSVLVGVRSKTANATTLEIWNGYSKESSILTVPYLIYEQCMELSPSGRWLATRGDGTLLDVYDLSKPSLQPVHRLDAHCLSLAFSPNENYLACGVQFGEVRCFEVESGIRQKNFAEWQSFWAWGMSCAFSPDSKYIASGNESGTIDVWNTETRELVSRLTGNQGEIHCLAFFPDGRRLISGGTGGIRLWDFQSGQELISLSTQDKHIRRVGVSETGDSVFAHSKAGQVDVWFTQPKRN